MDILVYLPLCRENGRNSEWIYASINNFYEINANLILHMRGNEYYK